MSEAVMKAEIGVKPKAAKRAEGWGFDIPRFDMPKVEVPAVVSELALRSVDQAKENYHRMAQAAEGMNEVFEKTYSTAVKSAAEYATKVAQAMDANADVAFDCARDLVAAKSFSELVERSTANMRKQFDALTAQNQELMTLAQKIMTESTKPIAAAASKVFETASSSRL